MEVFIKYLFVNFWTFSFIYIPYLYIFETLITGSQDNQHTVMNVVMHYDAVDTENIYFCSTSSASKLGVIIFKLCKIRNNTFQLDL